MCLKAGPRCYTHANEAYTKASQKWDKALAAEHSLQKQLNETNPDTKTYKTLEKKLDAARARLKTAADNKHEALIESRETAQGVELLAQKAEQAKKIHPGSMKTKRYTRDYLEAEAGYNAKLKKYDLENFTVDAKLPSGYASSVGLQYLGNQKLKNMQAWQKAVANNASDTKKYAENEEKLDHRIAHAKKTLERIYAGELPRLYAPPSPILQKSPEFINYVRTANAAESMKTVAAELNRVGLNADGHALVHPKSSAYPEYVRQQRAIKDASKPKPVTPDVVKDYTNVIRLEDLPFEERKRRESAIQRKATLSGTKVPELVPEIQGQGELF
jgi:hypothetical protein